jgi:polyhydroxyalkanoate synthase
VTFVLGASGNIAGVINPASRYKRNHWVGGADEPDPLRWLETVRDVPGSGWPEWSRWLAQHAGVDVTARKSVGNHKYKRIEPAPGRYVMEKA